MEQRCCWKRNINSTATSHFEWWWKNLHFDSQFSRYENKLFARLFPRWFIPISCWLLLIHSLIHSLTCLLFSFFWNIYIDGPRCGKTIADLFAKASNPDQLVIALIEQSYEEDTYCLEAYCDLVGTCISFYYLLFCGDVKVVMWKWWWWLLLFVDERMEWCQTPWFSDP